MPKLVLELKCITKDMDRKVETQGRDYAKTIGMDELLEVVLINQPPGSISDGQNKAPRPTTLHIHDFKDDGNWLQSCLGWKAFLHYVKEQSEDVVELRSIVETTVHELYNEDFANRDGFLERDYNDALHSRLVAALQGKPYYVAKEILTTKTTEKVRRSDIIIFKIP